MTNFTPVARALAAPPRIKALRPKEWKPNSIVNVTFLFRLDGGDLLEYLSVIYVIFRIGPGVRVGVGAGVGVDQVPGVGTGVKVGIAPPRLCTPAQN